MKHDPLIVALDVDSFDEARRFVKLLSPQVSLFKVGSYLFTAAGPSVVKMIQDAGGKVFLDLKFHDIPNTVARACEAALSLGVFMLNVHTSGGKDMMRAAAEVLRKSREPAMLLGVTVLTSDAKKKGTTAEVVKLANLAKYCGLTGVVCSASEARAVRSKCGKDFIIVTPGIRPPGASEDDQKRVAEPSQAIREGANYIVVGRPILNAADPLEVVSSIRSRL